MTEWYRRNVLWISMLALPMGIVLGRMIAEATK